MLCEGLFCGGAFRALLATLLWSKKGFPSCKSGGMKPEQQQCVGRVIIVHPNHSCRLSLLRFYPLITSAPPGGLSLAHTACFQRPDLAGFSFFTPLLYIRCVQASQGRTRHQLGPRSHKKTRAGCNSNPVALRWSLAAHSSQQLHIFQTLASIEALESFKSGFRSRVFFFFLRSKISVAKSPSFSLFLLG